MLYNMSMYRGISYYRVLFFVRMHGTRTRINMYRLPDILPIEDDLRAIGVVPHKFERSYYLDLEGIDCTRIPSDLSKLHSAYLVPLRQFVIDHFKGIVPVDEDEILAWRFLFASPDSYVEPRFSRSSLRLNRVNGSRH